MGEPAADASGTARQFAMCGSCGPLQQVTRLVWLGAAEANSDKASVERVGPRAVHVNFISATGRAEDTQVERRVAGLQWIERPDHRLQAHVAGAPTLLELEHTSDTGALMRRMHSGELGVHDQTFLQPPQEGEGESDQLLVGVESAEDEPADLLRAGHRGDGQHVTVFGNTPGAALQLLTSA